MPQASEQAVQAVAQALPPVAMHDRYGPLLRSFFARYFNPISFPTEAAERIREISKQGTVVYIAPAANLLHFLYLNHACIRHDLPLAQFVNGVDPVLVQPISLLWERMRRMGEEDSEAIEEEGEQRSRREMIATLRAGQAALLFLDKPTTITNPHDEKPDGLLDTLVQLQRTSQTPLYLLPHLIKWNVHPEREDKSVADAIFGQAEAPGFLRTLFLMLRNYRRAVVKIAEPIDLQAFLAEQQAGGVRNPASALEQTLQSSLTLEVFDVAGPKIRPHAEFRDEILADARIQSFIQEQAAGDEAKREALSKKAFDILDEVAAEPRIHWPLALNWVLNLFWNRMYEGFVVDEEGFERIRQAVRKSPVVFCPSHKSHVDYLVLSQLCLHYKVPLPHIAAGVNLSFWPMGPIFRHSGAFFMRRSFQGDELYPEVFRTYLRHVMQEGFPIEVFIEGTRSRTGKLLSPRFGILSWLLQAFQEGASEDLQFIPISIDYEKLVESGAYVRELSGGDKQKEDVAGLLKARKALRSRYGKIYVQVGQAISVSQVLAERGVERTGGDRDHKRLLVQDLAHRILFSINSVATVTPSAIVAFCLLNHRRRGMTHTALLDRARWLLAWVQRRGARLSATLDEFDRALADAIARFSRDGSIRIQDTGEELIYSVSDQRRLTLDYYRNNLIHHFVPAAISMLAVESFTVDVVPLDALRPRILDLSRLFKNEFLFRSERHFTTELRMAIDDLTREGLIREEDGFVVKVAEAVPLRQTFRAILEHFVEAYWLTARAMTGLRDGPMGEREFLSRTLQLGDRLFAEGVLLLQESMSRDIIKNAMQTFSERGLIETVREQGRKGATVQLLPAGQQAGALEALADEIHIFLNRE